jgi:hypothetical protein
MGRTRQGRRTAPTKESSGGSDPERLAMKHALPLLALCLMGCTTTRFVTVPCLNAEQYKKLEQSQPEKVHGNLTGEADKDLRIVAGSAVRLRAWGTGMLGVLQGCQHP